MAKSAWTSLSTYANILLVWGVFSWFGEGWGNLGGPACNYILDNCVSNLRKSLSCFNMMPCHMHKTSSIRKRFSQFGVEELDWPAQSPDLNPIQHLWDELERQLWAWPCHPTSVLDLTSCDGLVSEWEQIPAARFQWNWWKIWNQKSGGCCSSISLPMVSESHITPSHMEGMFSCQHSFGHLMQHKVQWIKVSTVGKQGTQKANLLNKTIEISIVGLLLYHYLCCR